MKCTIRPIALLLTSCLASCVTLPSGTQIQSECETVNRNFPDIYNCTFNEITKRNPGILSDPRAKLYLLRGEQLAVEVSSGRISTVDAKVEWQRLYVGLRSAKLQEIMLQTEAIERKAASERQNEISCDTTKYGNAVHTTCR